MSLSLNHNERLWVVDCCNNIVKTGQKRSGVAGTQREKMKDESTSLEIDSTCEPFSSVFLSRPSSGLSSCGVFCPMNFPKASFSAFAKNALEW